MEFDITHQPSYAHLVVRLEDGESIAAEPGAMVGHSDTVEVETTTSGNGILDSAKALVGGESAFANEFTAAGGPGRVSFAPPTPGDVKHHELRDETLYSVDGAFLASSTDVDVGSEFGGLKSMLGGAGVTPLALSGTGDVFLEAFGGLERLELDAGQSYTVDNQHLVAWDDGVEFDARRVGGLKSTLLSGEGIVLDFTGPGTVWYQTRGLDAFASTLADLLPGNSGGGGDGGVDIDV